MIFELNVWYFKSLGDEMEDVVCELENFFIVFYMGICKVVVLEFLLEVYFVFLNGEVIIVYFEDQFLIDVFVEVYWVDG